MLSELISKLSWYHIVIIIIVLILLIGFIYVKFIRGKSVKESVDAASDILVGAKPPAGAAEGELYNNHYCYMFQYKGEDKVPSDEFTINVPPEDTFKDHRYKDIGLDEYFGEVHEGEMVIVLKYGVASGCTYKNRMDVIYNINEFKQHMRKFPSVLDDGVADNAFHHLMSCDDWWLVSFSIVSLPQVIIDDDVIVNPKFTLFDWLLRVQVIINRIEDGIQDGRRNGRIGWINSKYKPTLKNYIDASSRGLNKFGVNTLAAKMMTILSEGLGHRRCTNCLRYCLSLFNGGTINAPLFNEPRMVYGISDACKNKHLCDIVAMDDDVRAAGHGGSNEYEYLFTRIGAEQTAEVQAAATIYTERVARGTYKDLCYMLSHLMNGWAVYPWKVQMEMHVRYTVDNVLWAFFTTWMRRVPLTLSVLSQKSLILRIVSIDEVENDDTRKSNDDDNEEDDPNVYNGGTNDEEGETNFLNVPVGQRNLESYGISVPKGNSMMHIYPIKRSKSHMITSRPTKKRTPLFRMSDTSNSSDLSDSGFVFSSTREKTISFAPKRTQSYSPGSFNNEIPIREDLGVINQPRRQVIRSLSTSLAKPDYFASSFTTNFSDNAELPKPPLDFLHRIHDEDQSVSSSQTASPQQTHLTHSVSGQYDGKELPEEWGEIPRSKSATVSQPGSLSTESSFTTSLHPGSLFTTRPKTTFKPKRQHSFTTMSDSLLSIDSSNIDELTLLEEDEKVDPTFKDDVNIERPDTEEEVNKIKGLNSYYERKAFKEFWDKTSNELAREIDPIEYALNPEDTVRKIFGDNGVLEEIYRITLRNYDDDPTAPTGNKGLLGDINEGELERAATDLLKEIGFMNANEEHIQALLKHSSLHALWENLYLNTKGDKSVAAKKMLDAIEQYITPSVPEQ